jgi:hypothetical protein
MPRGGARPGAGRKPKIFKDLEKTVAESLFSELGGESKAWEYLISHARQHDARLVFDILRYWTDRKYGKPSQRVEAQVDVGLIGLAERLAEARKRRYAEQDRRLLLENNPSIG